MKKLCALLLTLTLVFSTVLAVPVSAAVQPEDTTPIALPRFTYIIAGSVGLSMYSGGKAQVSSDVSVRNSMTCSITCWLQKKNNDGTWSNVAPFYSGQHAGATIAGGDYYVGRGTYRAMGYFYVYDSNGNVVETHQQASNTKTY